MSKRKYTSESFMSQYLREEVGAAAIDDFVDAWHEQPGKKEIFDFLGMTREEYALWLRDPEVLPHIAEARRTALSSGKPVAVSAHLAKNSDGSG